MYSTIGIIFAIFSAFVILSENERWNNLVDATKGEVNELNELWLWSKHFPKSLGDKFHKIIKSYLASVIKQGWKKTEQGQKSDEIEKIVSELHNSIFEVLKEAPDLMPTTFEIFMDILKHRSERLHYASFHLPKILKYTLLFSDVLLIGLSLLIGVRDTWLDYIFVLAIATLGYVIYIVVDDLDNPLRPGGWHLTTKDYKELLNKIK